MIPLDSYTGRPMAPPRTVRPDNKRVLTSCKAGEIVPVAYVPLLREDSVRSGRMRLVFDMRETARTLLNAVNVQVNAYFVPTLAMDRFSGIDEFNKSYAGQGLGDADPVEFLHTDEYGTYGSNEVYVAMGLHANEDQHVNLDVVESYNAIVNLRRRKRSKYLDERDLTNSNLAPAFWRHNEMRHIVNDFDQSLMDGPVEVTFDEALVDLHGLGTLSGGGVWDNDAMRFPDGSESTEDHRSIHAVKQSAVGFPDIWGELAAGTKGKVTLSMIARAKKLQSFAAYKATLKKDVADDDILDIMMSGIRVPDMAMREPILMAQKNTVFGYQERYATDAGNLDQSATRGGTVIDLNLSLPRMNTGGIIMITAEITPEQLFERQKDHWFVNPILADLPEYIRDETDPDKVAVVTNEHVDVSHNDPDLTFGYAPLNHQWVRSAPNVGGRFFRPEVDAAFDEDRQRLWAVETEDVLLNKDFFLCTGIHSKPFMDGEADNFDILATGSFQIEGNTVFGGPLMEADEEYDALVEQLPDYDPVEPTPIPHTDPIPTP